MMPVYSVAYAYALEGDTVKSAQYVQMIRISHDLPGRLCNLSKAAVTGNQTVYAEHLMERCITLFDSLRNIPDPGGDPLGMARNIKRYGSMFYTQYASILTKNGKIAKAAEYSGKAYENNTEDGEAAGNYAGLLVKGKQYAAALPILEKLVGKGLSNDEVKDILREAYTALNGGKGYDAYIAGLTKNLKQAAIDSARKNIISEPAPMFTLSDVDGKNWSLAELKGKVVVLDFWATWCAPCKKSFPAMQMAVNKYSRDPNVVFLFIHTWERGDNAAVDAKKYVTDNKFNFNVLMDVRNGGQNKVVSSFKAKGIPAKFVIDGNGNIRFKMTGFAGGNDAAVEELSAMIDLAKKS
jgi:thiol-disulfide isomerase/thioredoxin